ncbi:MAG: hypothetical protein ABIL76_06810 [candidate division WOR-3 bacterium]
MNHNEILEKVYNYFYSQKNFKIVRRNYGEFPKPDIYLEDEKGRIYSIECKGSYDNMREYITGIGQAVCYLSFSNYSYLAIPQEKVKDLESFLVINEIGLIAVSNQVKVIKEAKFNNLKSKPKISRGYAYYRDLKLNEIKEILKIINRFHDKPKEKIEQKIWNYLNKERNIKTSKNSWILNIKLFLRDLNIIDNNFKLTRTGYDLFLSIEDESNFKNRIKFLFLNEGNFKDIILIIDEQRKKLVEGFKVEKLRELVAERLENEKLSRSKESAKRDLNDIFRLLKDLEILDENYFINWKNVI